MNRLLLFSWFQRRLGATGKEVEDIHYFVYILACLLPAFRVSRAVPSLETKSYVSLRRNRDPGRHHLGLPLGLCFLGFAFRQDLEDRCQNLFPVRLATGLRSRHGPGPFNTQKQKQILLKQVTSLTIKMKKKKSTERGGGGQLTISSSTSTISCANPKNRSSVSQNRFCREYTIWPCRAPSAMSSATLRATEAESCSRSPYPASSKTVSTMPLRVQLGAMQLSRMAAAGDSGGDDRRSGTTPRISPSRPCLLTV